MTRTHVRSAYYRQRGVQSWQCDGKLPCTKGCSATELFLNVLKMFERENYVVDGIQVRACVTLRFEDLTGSGEWMKNDVGAGKEAVKVTSTDGNFI